MVLAETGVRGAGSLCVVDAHAEAKGRGEPHPV